MNEFTPNEPAVNDGLPPAQGNVISRERPDPSPGRLALVKEWQEKITTAKAHWEKNAFKAMRQGADFASGNQWEGPVAVGPVVYQPYQANLALRHINQRVASIYAKNPRVRATRKEKLYLNNWDGTPEQLAAAQGTVELATAPPEVQAAAQQQGITPPMDPVQAQTIIEEATVAQQQKKLYERMGKTLEIIAQYSMDEPIPKFKSQAKQLVRRVLTCKVGFLKLGYQRIMGYGTDVDHRIKDLTDKLKQIEVLAADIHDKVVTTDSADAEALKLQIADLQKQKDVVLREGLLFGFPKAWSVIVDPACTQLKGFVGAGWVAEEYVFRKRQVQKIFGVDPGTSFEAHTELGQKPASGDAKSDDSYCAVYEIYDLEGQQCMTILDGYPDFLKEPGQPDVATEQFHPYYTLSFNDTENPKSIYPQSDVEIGMPMWRDYNRAREGLRIHRQANRPATVVAMGVFDKDTTISFGAHADHEIIQTNLNKSEDITKLMVPKPTVPIQPELYEVEHLWVDQQRSLGDQAANLGGTSDATATEVTVAESSRATSMQSNIDDLDEFFTEVMRGAGQVLLMNMGKEQAMKIAGPAAAWPEVPATRQEVVEEMFLEIKAGSSGKPNRQGRLMAIEKVGPLLMQIPGVIPRKVAEFMLGELEETIDVEDFLDDSLPSITAMNSQAKPNLAPGPGNEAQGPQGAANAEAPAQSGAKAQNQGGGPLATERTRAEQAAV